MTKMHYWLWLAGICGECSPKPLQLLAEFGTIEAIYFAAESEYRAVPGLTDQDRKALSCKNLDKVRLTADKCAEIGCDILTFDSRGYPDRLRNIYAPPAVLYVLGDLPDIDQEAAIAVVGTRFLSLYGRAVAKKFSTELARAGVRVISGMARGVDTIAMQGALTTPNAPIGVVGCGLDQCYPAENRRLMQDVVGAGGAIVSEYEPGTPPLAWHFPQRNRIISGLALGTLVVEAPAKSGALITARYALEQGRDVFAVPGNIQNRSSEGCNLLLRDAAKPATKVEDILEEYRHLFPALRGESADQPGSFSGLQTAPNSPALDPAEIAEQTLTPDEEKILAHLSPVAAHVDEIAAKADIPVFRAAAALILLELKGLATLSPGGGYSGI